MGTIGAYQSCQASMKAKHPKATIVLLDLLTKEFNFQLWNPIQVIVLYVIRDKRFGLGRMSISRMRSRISTRSAEQKNNTSL